MRTKRGYDEKCHDLAMYFLDDGHHPDPVLNKAADDLAQQIQDLIEDFLKYDLVEMRKESS